MNDTGYFRGLCSERVDYLLLIVDHEKGRLTIIIDMV